MSGALDTTNYDKANLSFAHHDFVVTDGEKAIRDFLNNGFQKAVLNGLIQQVVRDAESGVQEQLSKWKDDLKAMLIEKLGTDEAFGDYWFLHGFVGNSTELVEALVPLSTVNTETDSENINAVMEMPEARTYAEMRFSHTMKNIPWWYQIMPGVAIGGLVALKFPRVGLAVGIVIAGLTVAFAGQIADSVGPELMGHTNVTIKAKLPEDAQEAGAPAEIKMHTWFEGTSMKVGFDPFPIKTLDTMMTNLAMKAADRPSDIPIKVVGANFKLWAKGHKIEIQEGSYGDVEVELDLSCFPNCPGNCGGLTLC